jgi:hypothetical protein
LTPPKIPAIFHASFFPSSIVGIPIMELLGSDTIVAEALKLPVADRVEVLHRLWDSLPRVANAVLFCGLK